MWGTDDDQIFPSREAHLGHSATQSTDTEDAALDDVIYFINQYRQTGNVANLRTAHALLAAEHLREERCKFCGGKGKSDLEYTPGFGKLECPKCKGTGKVEKQSQENNQVAIIDRSVLTECRSLLRTVSELSALSEIKHIHDACIECSDAARQLVPKIDHTLSQDIESEVPLSQLSGDDPRYELYKLRDAFASMETLFLRVRDERDQLRAQIDQWGE